MVESVMSWWPGWNSIEGAAKWGDLFVWVGFAFLVLLAGCEVLSKVYGWRKDTLLAMRDDLVAIAETVRTKQGERELFDTPRRDAEVAAPRAPTLEPETSAFPRVPQPQAPPHPQSPTQQPPRDADPLSRTSEQVARLQERNPRGLTEAQKKTIIGIL